MTLRRLINLLVCTGRAWSADNVSTTGAALAYYCAFSLAPLLVIILALAGPLLGPESATAQLQGQLTSLFGPSTARILLNAVRSSEQMHGTLSTITSIITLLIGATTVLSALQTALDQIWQSGKLVRSGLWGWLRARFLSLGFILALGFLLLVSLTVSTALASVRTRLASSHGAFLLLIGVLDIGISLSVVALLFAAIFKFMPTRPLAWRWALLGGFLTSALFEAGRWLIALYLAHSTQASAFGAAASFVALLVWLYYTAQIFLLGAEFTVCLAGFRESDSRPSSNKVFDGR